MPTYNQLVKKPRVVKKHKVTLKALEGCPFKRGVCLKVYTTKPKKPNSAIRKVAKVQLSNKKKIILAVPGIGHKLLEHSMVLVRGGRAKDLEFENFQLRLRHAHCSRPSSTALLPHQASHQHPKNKPTLTVSSPVLNSLLALGPRLPLQ